MEYAGYDYRKCSHPETMTKKELLAWAKDNFNHWADPDCGSVPANENQSAWYILFLWAIAEE